MLNENLLIVPKTQTVITAISITQGYVEINGTLANILRQRLNKTLLEGTIF